MDRFGYGPVPMILELAQLGLLDEQGGFRDLASAHQIAKLLGDGVRLSEIIRALSNDRADGDLGCTDCNRTKRHQSHGK